MKKRRKNKAEPIYSITDLNNYADHIRTGVATSFTEDYKENLDDFISIAQIINIIKQYSLGYDSEGNFLINATIFDEIFDTVRNWIYGVGLAKLAGKNKIECAWDSDTNEMIFWLPDNTTIIPQKPTKS